MKIILTTALTPMTTDQVEEMHSLLKQYHPYIVDRHAKTLLPQYLAMYRYLLMQYLAMYRYLLVEYLAMYRY